MHITSAFKLLFFKQNDLLPDKRDIALKRHCINCWVTKIDIIIIFVSSGMAHMILKKARNFHLELATMIIARTVDNKEVSEKIRDSVVRRY